MKTINRAAPWLIDLLVILGFVLVSFLVVLFGDSTLGAFGAYSDWLKLTCPSLTYTGKALASGKFPLWNPYWFAGYPHLACHV